MRFVISLALLCALTGCVYVSSSEFRPKAPFSKAEGMVTAQKPALQK